MAHELIMPRLSDSMEEGTILSWAKSVGDEVAVGEEIVEIETDKANMAYEADVAGTLTEILAEVGATLPVGAPIARIGGEGEGPSAATAGPVGSANGDKKAKASPLARRVAEARGVDLTSVAGSGPGGRIVKSDVEKAPAKVSVSPTPTRQVGVGETETAEQPETARGTVVVQEPSKLQQTVARRMSESKATAPHFYLQAEIDMSAAVEGRAQLKTLATEGEVVPSFNDMVVKACALALREFPKANGSYKDGRFELYSRVNVGVAVAAQEALVVPTVFDADRKGLRQIATETRELAGRVRDGSITPPELAGGTFTVSNLGMYGISNFSAVLNGGQAGILAVGAIATTGLMGVTLTCDHRILYGAEGAEFLARIKALLEEPISLAL